MAFILLVLALPDKPPYVVIEALTEQVRYRVSRPAVAAIPLVNATVRTELEHCPQIVAPDGSVALFSGLLKPAEGSVVTYRYLPELVSIELNSGEVSAGSLTFKDGASCMLPQHFSLFAAMGNVVRRPLPIAGPADIGWEMGAPSVNVQNRPAKNYMFGGTVQVFGRASAFPYAGALYPTANATFPLPAGGRLSSGDDITAKEPKAKVSGWYGVAEAGEKGFKVSAATISSDLRLYRPGGSEKGEFETFGLGMLTQIFSDPSVVVLTLFLLSFSFILQFVNIAVDVHLKRRGKDVPTPVESVMTTAPSSEKKGDDDTLA
ncbi:MAG: hypothetical protein PHI96_09295 [Desulfovibrio sp.]|nr:hypothetical protein [Desulfovibrio sp.]